jgi:hypothetical protein
MIQVTFQVKEIVKKLGLLTKVKKGPLINPDIICRIDNQAQKCELCLPSTSIYGDYYVYVNLHSCNGNGIFTLPHFKTILNLLKVCDKNSLISIQFCDDKIIITEGDEKIYEADSYIPEDISYFNKINTYYEKSIDISDKVLDYIKNLAKIISYNSNVSKILFDHFTLNQFDNNNEVTILLSDNIRTMGYYMLLDFPWPFGLCVIPRQALTWLASQRKSNNQSTVSIKSDGKYISFAYNNSYFVCEVNRTQYSYVNKFVKSKMDYIATFDVKTLSKNISYAVLGDKNKKVTISTKDYEAEIYNPCIENSKKWKMKCDIEYGNQLDLTLYASQLLPVLLLCDKTVEVYKLSDIDYTYVFKSMYSNFKYLIYAY